MFHGIIEKPLKIFDITVMIRKQVLIEDAILGFLRKIGRDRRFLSLALVRIVAPFHVILKLNFWLISFYFNIF